MDAEIRPHVSKEYTSAQSRFAHVPELPMRAIVVAPSGGGKTTLLVSLILDIYRGCWKRIHVFSSTALLDDAWKPIAKYCKEALGQEEDCHETFDEVKMCKERGMTRLYGSLIIVDDFADDVRVMRSSRSLWQLFVRGRHAGLSTILSTQKYRALAPIIRVNATDLFVFRLRSQAELMAICEENSAAYGKDVTEKIILRATEEPYSFLWINLRATRPEDLFWLKFRGRLQPKAARPTAPSAGPGGRAIGA
jgi:hypothetical protein